MSLNSEQQQVLEEARRKAGDLVKELEEKAAELEKNPPKIDAMQLEQGKAAMRNAVAAVRRALENIEQAATIADKNQPLPPG
jgi:hypothetical protein